MVLDIILLIMISLFLTTKSPMTLAIILMVVTTTAAVKMAISLNTSWISYIMMMVFISGMMVMILYATAMTNNETIKMPFKPTVLLMSVLLVFSSSFGYFYYKNKTIFYYILFEEKIMNLKEILIFKSYSSSMLIYSIFMVLFLFLLLIISVYLIMLIKTPMRKK